MKSCFAVSTMSALDEAADWLEGLGFLVERSPDRRGHRLVVHHDEALAYEVHRIVEMVDPTTVDAHLVDVRRTAFRCRAARDANR